MTYEDEKVDGQQKDGLEGLRNIYDDHIVLYLENRSYETFKETAERIGMDIEDVEQQ